ncbi:armadillo-type protein [Blakeslea trispora]|nr:armadillo-type protein [Blakeslea trispora]
MVISEFEPDDIFKELNQKFANVSLDRSDDQGQQEILFDQLSEYRDTLEYSSEYHQCYYAMKNIRRYLTQSVSLERIQHVFDLDLQDRFRTILETPGYDELKYETAWTITNLAYGSTEHAAQLIDTGVIDALIYCFRSTENYRVKSQTAWALANISIESPRYRESMAHDNLIGDIAQALSDKCHMIATKLQSAINQDRISQDDQGQIICHSKPDAEDIKDLTWSLANVCRGGFRTVEHWEQYLIAFQAFSQCINFENRDIWSEACWGLSRIFSNMYDYTPFYQSLELDPTLCPRLVHLLRSQPVDAVLPILQTISNFSSGPNDFVEILLSADLLSNVWWYLSPDTPHQLRRNAMLTVSNLAAGHEDIVFKVVSNENCMKYVMAHLQIPGHRYHPHAHQWRASSNATIPESIEEWRIVKEAMWVLSNTCTLADADTIFMLLHEHTNLIYDLANLLHYPALPEPICLKIVGVLLCLVNRTNQTSGLHQEEGTNTYAEQIIQEGVMPELNFLCRELGSHELSAQTELLHTALLSSTAKVQADAFGLPRQGLSLPGTDVRRIVHGFEDGDVRLIEHAFNYVKID